MANRHSLDGPLQREVAVSALVRQGDKKESALAWDTVGWALLHDARRGVIEK